MLNVARRLVGLLALAVTLTVAFDAFAGSYLDRAAILLEEARREGDTLQPRTFDKEFVLVVKTLAEARVRVANKMEVPSQVTKAHPHLLLVLANYERAADFASEGNFKKCMEHLMTARDEERAFRALVAELGYSLPDFGKR